MVYGFRETYRIPWREKIQDTFMKDMAKAKASCKSFKPAQWYVPKFLMRCRAINPFCRFISPIFVGQWWPGLAPINQDTPIWMKVTTTGWTWVASELVIEVRWLNQESSWMIPKFAISVWKSTINHLFGIPCCETPLIAGYHLRSPPAHPPSKARIIIILVVFIVTH